MNSEQRLEELTRYLRGLSSTLNDHMLGDAADMLDELHAALYVASEELGSYEVEEADEAASQLAEDVTEHLAHPPSSSGYTPVLRGLPRGSTLLESSVRLWASQRR